MATYILVQVTHARPPTKRLSSALTQRCQKLCNRSSRVTLSLGPSLGRIHLAVRFSLISISFHFSHLPMFALGFIVLLLLLNLVWTQPIPGIHICRPILGPRSILSSQRGATRLPTMRGLCATLSNICVDAANSPFNGSSCAFENAIDGKSLA